MTETKTFSKPRPIWRTAAVAIWLFIAFAYLTFYLLETRLDFEQLQIPCSGESCNFLALSAAEIEVLQSSGFSARAYATFMLGVSTLTVAIYWTLGGLILLRRGTTRIGLVVSLFLLAIPITMISDTDNLAATYPSLLGPSLVLSWLGLLLLLMFLYLFPNGRFYPKWAFIPFAIGFLINTIGALAEFGGAKRIDTPEQLNLFLSLLIFLLVGIMFQVLRYFRVSNSAERQQTKWVLLGFFMIMLGFPIWFFFFAGPSFPPGETRLLASLGGWILSLVTSLSLAFAITIAILRYRLWDIDVIIRKTLIYGLLTGLLVLLYLATVTLMQDLLAAVTGQRSPLAVVISTLAIAALFNPLRIRVQTFIDRRFYRRKYDTDKALADFSLTVRDEVDLESLSDELLSVVGETMQPEQASIWLLEEPDRKSSK